MRTLIVVPAFLISLAWAQTAQDPGWPRTSKKNGAELVYYQPQVDEWKDHRQLDGRMAISLTPAGGSEPAVGVVYLRFRTDVDVANHNVTLSAPQITKTNFPFLDVEGARQMDALVRTFLPPAYTTTMSLDRLIASVEKPKTPPRTAAVKNDPPKIFVSKSPAILLLVDGDPVRAPIEETKLENVVNANWPVFSEKKKKDEYYLLVGKRWLTAATLEGPWTPAKKLPKDMKKVAEKPDFAALKGTVPLVPSEAPVPHVFYSSTPAEIIGFGGEPVYSKVPGTELVFATNTDSDVFVYSPTKAYYYLTAGRWFSATDLNGPWKFASANLPADFARIPPNGPGSHVLVSVPGTPEAADAVLMAQIPTRIVVDPVKAAQQVKVTYSGEPQFKPIEGTSLSYATNTSEKVIKVGDLYYACYQGVWFTSASPQGPWKTATSVPKEIYSIPESSPVYNVTYVTQETTSDGNVEASHTAGYVGMFVTGVAVGAVIGWGTGYYYPPYVYYPSWGYPVYRPYPYTYGYGGYGYGYGYGGATYRAGYNPATGTYGRGATAYGPYGSRSAGHAYNPYTGTYARGASASTGYGSRSAARAYNPYTGAYGATRQGSTPYSQWGTSAVTRGGEAAVGRHYSTAQGAVGSVQTSSGGRAVGAVGDSGRGYAGRTASGDLYAGRDGNVYKNDSGSWQQYKNGNWESVDRSAASDAQRSQLQGLQSESANRQRGSTESQRYQSSRGFSGGGGRSFSRGGGRRR